MSKSSQSPQSKRGGGQDHSQFTKGKVNLGPSAPDRANEGANKLIGASEKDREGGFPPDVSARR
jgi:hypothetical protein